MGSALVPKLLQQGYRVRVLDLYIFGDQVLDSVKHDSNLRQIKGDIRDVKLLEESLKGCDAVIHLACISNDPSFELDPALGRVINYEAFTPLVRLSKKQGVKRFVYASSSSVYGIKDTLNVTEDLPLEPLTDYSKYKALCEEILLKEKSDDFTVLILRPATVCGYSTRLRLDLTVNILTNAAIIDRKITVFGGSQMRPNIHIEDMTNLYVKALEWPDKKIDGKIFNAGYHNHRVIEIAEMVKKVVGDEVKIVVAPTNDNRSYHISSEKIRKELGFLPHFGVEDAVRDLVKAYAGGKVPNSKTDIRYSNIRTMQHLKLK